MSEMAIANKIRSLMELNDLSYSDLSELTNISRSTLQRYATGQSVNIPIKKLTRIAHALHSTPEAILGWEETEIYTQTVSVVFPIIGEVSAGYNGLAQEEETGDYISIPQDWLRGHQPNDFFVLSVKGSSMYPDYQEGDKVLIKRTTSVDSGSTAVVLFNGEQATLKKIKYACGENWLELIPRNPEYQIKRIEGEELTLCRILGEAKMVIRSLNK